MCTFSSPVWAQSQQTDIRPNANRLIGEILFSEFNGITHKGAYNFSHDGKAGKFYTETTQSDGRTHYKEKDLDFMGNWAIIRDKLCFRYDSPDLTGGCFRVYKVGNCFYYYSDYAIERKNELDYEYWTARSTKAGEPPSCEPGLS